MRSFLYIYLILLFHASVNSTSREYFSDLLPIINIIWLHVVSNKCSFFYKLKMSRENNVNGTVSELCQNTTAKPCSYRTSVTLPPLVICDDRCIYNKLTICICNMSSKVTICSHMTDLIEQTLRSCDIICVSPAFSLKAVLRPAQIKKYPSHFENSNM